MSGQPVPGDPRERCLNCDTPLWLYTQRNAVIVWCSSCKTEIERTRVVER